MRSIPYVTRLLKKLASRDPKYAPVSVSAQAMQFRLVYDGIVKHSMVVSEAEDMSGFTTPELECEIDNTLGSIKLAQMWKPDNYHSVDSLQRKFQNISK